MEKAKEKDPIRLLDVGTSDYESVWAQQKQLVDEIKGGNASDALIFVEHAAVYTYGRKSALPTIENAKTIAVERGGEATYHNPGQLVCYPILYLEGKERDVHLHLRRLESTIIDLLEDWELEGERREGATGVWLKGREKKIASIGIAVSGWVTYHGSALNVNNDLSGFKRINPCGFSGEVMTSLKEELGDRCPDMATVKRSFLKHFSTNFRRSSSFCYN